jgi:predicted metal-dependent hydrolase
MLTAKEYEKLIATIMEKYDYPDYPVKVRFSNMLGSIAYIKTFQREITISKSWFACNGADFAVYILKHEIAHLKYPNHSLAFKRECLRLGIKAKAKLKNKDFIAHNWNVPAGVTMNGILSMPKTICCKFEDCKELV